MLPPRDLNRFRSAAIFFTEYFSTWWSAHAQQIERYGAGSTLVILPLVTMLMVVAWVIGVARPALAEKGS